MPADLAELSDEQILRLLKLPKLSDIVRATSPWMTPELAAEYLGISLGTLRNWTSAHFVPFSKKGRVVRYHRETIDRWLARGGCAGRTTLADLPE